MEVSIGISNRHIHLTESDYKILFGDFKMEEVKSINQPGQFASNCFVDLKNGDNVIEHVRLLGPLRSYTQVEISQTDARKLKLNPPVRMSGHLENSSPITIIGPNGSLDLKEGCIIADRHIHMLPEQAKEWGFEGVEKVSVELGGEKGGRIDNVYLRIAPNSYFEMHIDTDDGNAHLVKPGDIGTIIK